MAKIYEWANFLSKWDQEIMEILGQMDKPHDGTRSYEALQRKSLRFKGASNEEITGLEKRLGVTLPPSYVDFLKVTNGWLQLGMDAEDRKIWSTAEVAWFKDQDPRWLSAWEANMDPIQDDLYFVYGPQQDPVNLRTEYLRTSLAISEGVDSAIYLLNPKVVTAEGEWEAWFFGNALPGANRYQSFGEMMQAEHQRVLRNLKSALEF